MASLFDTLQANAFRSGITARTKESKKWFHDCALIDRDEITDALERSQA